MRSLHLKSFKNIISAFSTPTQLKVPFAGLTKLLKIVHKDFIKNVFVQLDQQLKCCAPCHVLLLTDPSLPKKILRHTRYCAQAFVVPVVSIDHCNQLHFTLLSILQQLQSALAFPILILHYISHFPACVHDLYCKGGQGGGYYSICKG